MATAPAMGRPLTSRPPHHQKEPRPWSKCVDCPYSNGMTTSMSYWNHQANISHHYRQASTVQIVMEKRSIQMWTGKRTGVWPSPEPLDPELRGDMSQLGAPD